jgi:glutamate N-acetyltransferase/amino-acid N-acetyltransferase
MPPRLAGFQFAGVSAGIKKKEGALDVGVIAADRPAAAAAVFTTNRVAAAPVIVSRANVRAGKLRAIVAQSGNANACTGKQGLADAKEMTARAANALGGGARASQIGVASTGVIGFPLPMDRVRDGIDRAVAALSGNVAAWERFTEAILTTDKAPKRSSMVDLDGGFEIIGCAKGAGMICPHMATTLAFVLTDAPVAVPWLRRLLREEVDRTFNRVTVDGDTSTNDSVFLLASGAAGGATIQRDDRRGKLFRAALREVLGELATMLVRDGEGATRVVEIQVTGARTARDATEVARRIANSPLVKTAIGGADPNWGRILGAAGASGVAIDPARLSLWIGAVPVVRRGVGVHGPTTEKDAHAVMSGTQYAIRLDLGAGKASDSYRTCDLTHEYVTINADYRS